jgi:proline iminopeptidase
MNLIPRRIVAGRCAAEQPLNHESGLTIFMNLRPGRCRAGGCEPSRYHRGVPLPTLHSDSPLLCRHALTVGEGHVLNVEEYGHAQGIPALVLHGGPGSGCSPLQRRFFDPRRYRIICPDQRGAGGSRPRGGTHGNTTADLLSDLHTLRRHLGLAHWLVVGGSWGATLAMAHAAAEPPAVQALLLRASFLARREDIDWFFQGARAAAPQAWANFSQVAPPEHREEMLPCLARTLDAGEPAERRRAALAWWAWEQLLASGAAGGMASAPPEGDALDGFVDRYRVQSHYMMNDCWLRAPPLLERLHALPRVPTLLLHGSEDRICRPAGASAVHDRIAHSRLHWVQGAGHDPSHPAMAGAMVAALDTYAAQADVALSGQAGLARPWGPADGNFERTPR